MPTAAPNQIFREALAFARGRAPLPTALNTMGLRELPRDVRMKSLFSARNTNADILQDIGSKIEGLLQGEFNEATARAQLQDAFDAVGYQPATGFPEGERVPPAEEGGLRDLSSDKRIRLVLETNLRQAANFGFLQQGNDPLSRWQYPAFELVRIYDREEPRGEMPGSMGWNERWVRAGGELTDGDRMIALKDDSVWDNLGDSNLFDDGLDSPFPPFAFNSGMGWREVPREEAIEMGLIDGNEIPSENDARFFDEEMQADAEQFSTEKLLNLRSGIRERIAQLT
jgi:hypothetical protein